MFILQKSIVRKTFIFSFLLILLVVVLSFTILYFAMPHYYLYQKEQKLQQSLTTLTLNIHLTPTQEECATLIADFVVDNNAFVTVFDRENNLLPQLSSPLVSLTALDPEGCYLLIDEDDSTNKMDGISMVDLQYQVMISTDDLSNVEIKTQISRPGDTIVLQNEVESDLISRIKVNSTLQPIDEAKNVMLKLMPYVLISGMALGLLLAWFYARQLSKPILQISEATVRMQNLEPDAKSTVTSDDELGLLSHNLNALYASLKANISSLQLEMDNVNRIEKAKTEMMQSASHELKTPIAALNGMLEGMIDHIGVYKDKEKYLRECKNQVEKLSLLVAEILNASKMDDAMFTVEREATDVMALLEQSLEDFSLPLREKDLQLKTELQPLTISTDPSLLYRAITNLVSNAVRYTPVQGEIYIRLNPECLIIGNEGQSIAEAELSKLVEPFYTRSYHRDKNQSGTGLGLYIVKRCLDKLEIPYAIASNGGWFTFTLWWPQQELLH